MSFPLEYTVLEGHRVSVRAIHKGEKLLSWGLSFGVATTGEIACMRSDWLGRLGHGWLTDGCADIAVGTYVINAKVLSTLAQRVAFTLPPAPNFEVLPRPVARTSLAPHRFEAATD